MNSELADTITQLDTAKEKLSEHSILSRIKCNKGEDESDETRWEDMAFSFMEARETGWGTYYGPMMVWTDDDGVTYESPELSAVDKETLNYWALRSGQTQNPIMTARYAGLVWDLTPKVLGKCADHTVAISHVEALVTVCERQLFEHSIEAIQKIERAYNVARSLNNGGLVRICISTAIRLEDEIAEDESPGLWGFSFELFVLSGEKLLTDEQRDHLIRGLEARLERIRGGSPFACEAAGVPLATYYRKHGRADDVRRVIGIVGVCFENDGEGQSAMLASSRYQHAHNLYISFNLHAEAEAVLKKIAAIGTDILADMKELSYFAKVPEDELEKYLVAMTDGGLEDSLHRIARRFIPKRGKIENQVLDLAKNYPLQFLFPTTLHDHKGRPVAIIGDINSDLEGRTINQLSQNMSMDSFFFRHCINRMNERYGLSSENLAEFILQTPIIEKSKHPLISKGINAFLSEDYITSIHVLVPQIEAAIRILVELMSGATLRKNRQGGLQLRTLDDLLRDDAVETCFGPDISFYFRALLTDQRGWNIRNDTCHGISPDNAFSYVAADRVLHVLLCIAKVQKKDA